MSGIKHVTISDAEYYRLTQNDQQLRAIRHDMPDLIRQLRQRTSEDLQRRLGPIEQRQQAFQGTVEKLNTHVRELERDTSKRLEQQRRQLHQELQRTAGQLRGETREQVARMATQLRQETRSMLEAQEQRMTRLIDQERQERQAAFDALHDQVGALQAEQQRKLELARSWIEAAETIQGFIGEQYQHERFAPSQLSKLARDLRRAQENLASNAPEAALSTAQQAYQGLSDLRVELEQKEQEWQLWRTAALEDTRALLATAQHNRMCQAHGADDQPLDIEIEVDHWTDGRLSAHEARLQKMIDAIDHGETLSTDELRTIVEQQVPALEYEQTGILRDARLAVLSSQRRVNIADQIVQSLEQEGFVLDSGTYEESDMRSSYVVKTQHLDGGEVVVRVMPEPGRPGQNTLEVLSYDYEQVGQHEAERRMEGINSGLRAMNLEVTPPLEAAGRPDRRWLDIAQIAQPATERQVLQQGPTTGEQRP